MTQRTSPFLGAKYGWDYGESGWNIGMDENLLKFSYLFDRNVEGIVSTLPAAVDGLAYFLTTDNRLYFGVGTTWYSSSVPKWFILTIKNTGETFQFNGTSLISVPSNSELSTQLGAVQVTLSELGTASLEDVEYFASQAQLDIASAQANSYTDTLRADLSTSVTLGKGALQVSGNIVSVVDYEALRQLPVDAVADTFLVQSAYISGDKGSGLYKRVVSTDPENIPFLVQGNAAYVMVKSGAISAAQFGVREGTDPTAAIQMMMDEGGSYTIPNGFYDTTGSVYVDHSALDFPEFFRANNKRVVLQGESASGTIISYDVGTEVNRPFFHLEAGKLGPAQGGGSLAYITDMQIVRPADGYNVIDERRGVGVAMTNVAFVTMRDVRATFMNEGFRFTGMLTSDLTNVQAFWCKYGFRFIPSALALCNALAINNPRAAGCSKVGILFEGGGSGVNIRGGTVEQCGTTTDNSSGGIRMIMNTANGDTGLRVDGVYFEGNGGLADIYFDNATATPTTIYIGGCTFNRVSATHYTDFNIYIGNSGGGGVKVVLNGNTHHHYGDYSPTFLRPFVSGEPGVEFFGWDTCTYIETNSASEGFTSAGSTIGGHINRDGSFVTAAPSGVTCVRQSAGVYLISKPAGRFGASVGGFKVTASVNDLNNTMINYVRNESNNSFLVVTCPIGGGAATDAEFTFLLTTTG